jgi:plasmid replication initiation protein
MDDEDRQDGVLSYSFDAKLIPLLRESGVFGKLELRVIWAFASKYALALYEAVARRVRLQHVWMEELDIAALRELLRVPPGKLERFADLNRKALRPAVLEVNALAPFEVHAREWVQGKRVVGVTLGWSFKDQARKDAAWREVQRPRVGRRARLRGLAEHVVTPADQLPQGASEG